MGKDIAKVQQLKESVFAVIGLDGLTNFGIIKGNGGSAVLIDEIHKSGVPERLYQEKSKR